MNYKQNKLYSPKLTKQCVFLSNCTQANINFALIITLGPSPPKCHKNTKSHCQPHSLHIIQALNNQCYDIIIAPIYILDKFKTQFHT